MSRSIDRGQMVTCRELNEGKRKTKGRGRIGAEGREICDVLQDERVCPSVDVFFANWPALPHYSRVFARQGLPRRSNHLHPAVS